ncbi:uroporphyrinogen-III C-methyltransferase [Aestuariirhabdus litorea]|uniref:Heme biosynthesis operon protein HemX n=1 Tax=Aestuariirhabdus litorea TaxID=2528527 RepID=A0A3P3VQ75_9GAMM|nr:uroporphyrinogen-III C-methyltransferase [Aestuariirhabdus litorea]RRJ82963.1 hypothetical protein D0544_14035 [Aestuariirhabdus litorea]RWW93124.1 hypothetical protein DZC74_14010 [Endozoicomonadaceae bacterium GTF-13]
MSKKRGQQDSEQPSEQENTERSTGESIESSRPAVGAGDAPSASPQTTAAVAEPEPAASEPLSAQPSAMAGEKVAPVSHRLWLALLALLLALVACGGVVALVYMDRNIQYYLEHRTYPASGEQLNEGLKNLQSRIDADSRALRQELSTLSLRADEQGRFEQRLQAAIDAFAQDSQRLQNQLNELQRTSREDWQLAEVEYLLRLANQRLLTEGDVTGVEALLSSADRIVRELDNVSLFPVREALAADLVAIRAVPRVDREGVYLQLAALSQQSMSLPLLPVGGYQRTQPPAPETVIDGDAPLWQRLMVRAQASFERFSGYFRLNTQRSEPLQELLTPDEEVYLRQNLRLMMEQAQLALLKGQQRVFDSSLSASLEWLERYFSHNTQAALSMVQQIEQLQRLQLDPERPDISGSLKAIKAFNEQLHRRGGAQ